MKKQKLQNLLLVIFCVAMVIAVRVFVNYKFSLITTGYDYGFYYHAITHTATLSWHDWLPGLFNSYYHWLFYFFNFFTRTPEQILLYSILLNCICIGLVLAFWSKDRLLGFWLVALYTLSLIQTRAYSMFLWKNMAGVALMLLGLKLLEKNKRWWCVGVLVLLLTTHKTTAIIYFLCLLGYEIWYLHKEKKYRQLFWEVLAIAGAEFLLLASSLLPFLHNPNQEVKQGIFIGLAEFIKFTWPYLIFAVCGVYYSFKQKKVTIILILLLISLIWSVLHGPFYKRILIFLDLGLIFFAANFFTQIKNFFNPKLYILISILICALLTFWYLNFFTQATLISYTEIAEIKKFDAAHQNSFVLSLDTANAPWLFAYLQHNQVAAPGLFTDKHIYQVWLDFWAEKNQRQFLSIYPKPLFLYQKTYIIPNSLETCLKQISESLYEFICN